MEKTNGNRKQLLHTISVSQIDVDPYAVNTPPKKGFQPKSVVRKRREFNDQKFASFVSTEAIESEGENTAWNKRKAFINSKRISSQSLAISSFNSRINASTDSLNMIRNKTPITSDSNSSTINLLGNEQDINSMKRDYQVTFSRKRMKRKRRTTVHPEAETRDSPSSLHSIPSKELIIKTISMTKTSKKNEMTDNDSLSPTSTHDSLERLPSIASQVTYISSDKSCKVSPVKVQIRPRTSILVEKKVESLDIKRFISTSFINRTILICFTSGLISSVVGVISLKDPSFINDHLPFRVFYPTGTLLMMTILLLKCPQKINIGLTYSAATVLFIIPITVTSIILKFDSNSRNLMSYESQDHSLSDPILSPSVVLSMLLFAVQLSLSFLYVFFCLQEIDYR